MSHLAKIRKTLGFTQADIESATGIDASSLSLYENGLRIPPLKNAKMLGALYGVHWSKIIEWSEKDDRLEFEEKPEISK